MLPKTQTGKVVFYSVIAFLAIYYLVPYVHEFAHAAVCNHSGHEYTMIIIYTGEARAVICHDYPDNLTLYRAVGGLAGTATAAAIAFIPKQKILFIAAFPFVPQQAMITGIETLAHSWYNTEQGSEISSLLASIVSISLFLVLVLNHRYKMIQSQRAQGSQYKE